MAAKKKSWLETTIARWNAAKRSIKIVLGAVTTVSAVMLFMFLTSIGVVITSDGDILCGTNCDTNIYLTNFTKDITVDNLSALKLDFSPNPEDFDLLMPVTTKGKTTYISYKDLKSFTFKAGQNYTLKLHVIKKGEDTIKYNFTVAGTQLDPLLVGAKPEENGTVKINNKTYRPDDFFVRIVDSYSGISDKWAVFEVRNPSDFQMQITNKELFHSFNKKNEDTNIRDTKYFYEVRNNVSEMYTECNLVKNGTLENGTDTFEQVCNRVEKIHEEGEWVDFTSLILQPNQTKRFRVEITTKATLGDDSIDWIPQLNVSSVVLNQTKWLWFNSSYGNRIQINISVFRENDTVEINLTMANVTCAQINCTDGVVVDQNDVELKWYKGGLNNTPAWVMMVDNITGRNRPKNSAAVYFVPQNGSLFYWFYYNSTTAINSGGSWWLWEDDFQRYNNNTQPVCRSNFTAGDNKGCGADNGANGFILTELSTGNRGYYGKAGNVVDGFNLTQYRNITVQWELDATGFNENNAVRFDIFGANEAGAYRLPGSRASNSYGVYNEVTDPVNFIGSFITYSNTGPMNFTSQRDGNMVNFWINHSLKGGNISDTVRVTHSKVAFLPGIANKTLYSIRAWNVSINTYAVNVNVTYSGVMAVNETPSINQMKILQPNTTVPVNVTYPQNITINFTVIDNSLNVTENITVSNVTIGTLPGIVLNTSTYTSGTINVTFGFSKDDVFSGQLATNCATPTTVSSFNITNNAGDNITYFATSQVVSTDTAAEVVPAGKLMMINGSDGALLDSATNEISVNTVNTTNDYVFMYKYVSAPANATVNITACSDAAAVFTETKWIALVNVNSTVFRSANTTISSNLGSFSATFNATSMQDTSPRIVLLQVSINGTLLTGAASFNINNRNLNLSTANSNILLDWNELPINMSATRPNSNYAAMYGGVDTSTGASFEQNYTVRLKLNGTVTTINTNYEIRMAVIQVDKYFFQNSSSVAIGTTDTTFVNITTNFAANTPVCYMGWINYQDTDSATENIIAGAQKINASTRNNLTSNERNLQSMAANKLAGSNFDKSLFGADYATLENDDYKLSSQASAGGYNGKGRLLVMRCDKEQVSALVPPVLVSVTNQTWFQNLTWHTNVSIPNYATGLKDLYVEVQFNKSGTGAFVVYNDINLSAVNYGTATDSCTPTSNQNWNIVCSDFCKITRKAYTVENISISGTGIVYIDSSNITYKNFETLASARANCQVFLNGSTIFYSRVR